MGRLITNGKIFLLAGSMTQQLNECFKKAVLCTSFHSQRFTKTYQFSKEGIMQGSIGLCVVMMKTAAPEDCFDFDQENEDRRDSLESVKKATTEGGKENAASTTDDPEKFNILDLCEACDIEDVLLELANKNATENDEKVKTSD